MQPESAEYSRSFAAGVGMVLGAAAAGCAGAIGAVEAVLADSPGFWGFWLHLGLTAGGGALPLVILGILLLVFLPQRAASPGAALAEDLALVAWIVALMYVISRQNALEGIEATWAPYVTAAASAFTAVGLRGLQRWLLAGAPRRVILAAVTAMAVLWVPWIGLLTVGTL